MSEKIYKYEIISPYNGIAKNPYSMNKGECVDMGNLNVYSIFPMCSGTKNPSSIATLTKEMYNFTQGFFFGEDGYVYYIDGTNVHQTTVARDIICAFVYREKIFFRYIETGQLRAGSIDFDEAETTSLSWSSQTSYTEIHDALRHSMFDVKTNYKMTSVQFADNVYISYGKKVYRIEKGYLLKEMLEFNSPVQGLTQHGSRIRVYLEDKRHYLRDGFAEYAGEVVEWEKNIKAVKNYGAIDIVRCNKETKTEMWMCTGYQKIKLIDYLTQYEFKHQIQTSFTGAKKGDQYLLPGDDPVGIYSTYGLETGELRGFNLEYQYTSTGEKYDVIHQVVEWDGEVYVCYEDEAGGIGIDQLGDNDDVSVLGTTEGGFFIDKVIDGEMPEEKKVLTKIEFIGKAGSGSEVTLSFKKDQLYETNNNHRRKMFKSGYNGFTTIKTRNDATRKPKYIVYEQDISDIVGDWYDIQFKVDVKGRYRKIILYFKAIKGTR